MAEAAWTLLLSHARVADEKWDADEMRAVPSQAGPVQEAYRTAARYTHPDSGGTSEAFAAVDRAKHVLMHWLSRPDRSEPPPPKADCGRCHGKGFILSHRAWKTLRIQCPQCRGTGDENAEHEKGDYR